MFEGVKLNIFGYICIKYSKKELFEAFFLKQLFISYILGKYGQ